MTYTARGSLDLASTPDIEIELEGSRERFISAGGLTSDEVTDLRRKHGATRSDLALFAGFDLSDSEFGKAEYADENGRIYHTLRFNGGSYDEHRMSLVVNHFTSLGMGVQGEFMGDDGATWLFEADFGSKLLANDDLVPVRSERLKIYQERETLLVQASEVLEKCLAENKLLKYKARAFDDIVNVLGYEPDEIAASIKGIVHGLVPTYGPGLTPEAIDAVELLGRVGQIVIRGWTQVLDNAEDLNL